MSKKKEQETRLVYSTDPNFRLDENGQPEQDTIPPSQQKLKVRIDTKQRAGKSVTIVEGFVGRKQDVEDLGKKLKTYSGTGGSVKDRVVIIQGDQQDKIMQWLNKNGYTSSKKI